MTRTNLYSQLLAAALWVLPTAQALDVTLKKVECDESLPIVVLDNTMTVKCEQGDSRCSLGSDVTLHGKLKFSGVDRVGLVDGFAFVSADMVFRSVEFQMLQYLQAPICGQYVIAEQFDANDDGEYECPVDGVYEFYVPYVLPNEESKATWLATGWGGVGTISIFAEANNLDSLIGTCELTFATSVTPAASGSVFAKLPVPSAMVTMLAVLAFASLLVCSCLYRTLSDCAFGKQKKNKPTIDTRLLEDDFIMKAADGDDHMMVFRKVEEEKK